MRTTRTTASFAVMLLIAVRTLSQGIEWQTLNFEALRLYGAGEYDRAQVLAEKALNIAQVENGQKDPSVATALNTLGLVASRQGHYGKAKSFYERSLAIMESALDPKDPRVATTLNNLGMVYKHEDDYAKAQALLKRALVLREKNLPPLPQRCRSKPGQPGSRL